MSLQVYLPFRGSLDNIGINSTTATVLNNTTYTTDTDRGTVLNTTADGQGVNLAGYMAELKTYTNYSMMAWVYFNTTPTNHSSTIISSGDWNQAAGQCCFAYYHSNNTLLCPNTTGWSNGVTLPTALSTGRWYHIAITYNGSKTIAYINGEKAGEMSGGGIAQSSNTTDVYIGSATYYTGFTLKGKIYDVRIYNTCISEFEVQKIIKQTNISGLIAHYPLSNNGIGYKNYNLVMNTYSMPINDSSTRGFRLSGTGTVTHQDYDNLPIGTGVIRLTNSTSATAWGGIAQDSLKGFISGKIYSQSCWVRASGNDVVTNFYFQPIWISNTQTTGQTTQTYNITTEWQYIKCEGMYLPGDQAEAYSAGYAYCNLAAGAWIEICGMKVEEGGEATPWKPHRLDRFNPYIKYDTVEYIEPDGSRWFRIFHHNNPAGGVFNSSDDFANGVYIDANRWYNVEQICDKVNKYEFMIKQQPTSSSVPVKYRWIQYTHPLAVTNWSQVQPAAVTRITTNDYNADASGGGIYRRPGETITRLVRANYIDGNWYGAIGSWTAYQDGIPGVSPTVVTTGYMDLYIRVDNATEEDIEYDISGNYLNCEKKRVGENLFIGSSFSSADIEIFNNYNSSDDMSLYLRPYNVTASKCTFSNDTCTVPLDVSGSNLGLAFVRSANEIALRVGTTTYTISCEAKCNVAGAHLDIGLSYKNTANTWIWRGGSNPQNFNATNTWQKFTFTFTPDADTQYISYCFTVLGTGSSSDTFSIRHCKLEAGSTATSWQPHYSRHWYIQNSPKYKGSTYFDGHQGLHIPFGYSWCGKTDGSLTAWVNPEAYNTTFDRSLIIIWYGVSYLTINSSGKLSVYAYGKDPAGYHNSNVTIPLNQWTHVAVIWDAYSVQLYINGKLDVNLSCTGSFSYGVAKHAFIGYEIDYVYRGFEGDISDVRVYNKALTAKEVLSLYNNEAYIDDDDVIHGEIR